MSAITKKLHFIKGGVDNSITLYNTKADVGNDVLALQVDSAPAYAKLGATNDSKATSMRIQKNGVIYAVLASAIQHYSDYESFTSGGISDSFGNVAHTEGLGTSVMEDPRWKLSVHTQDDVAQLIINTNLPSNATNIKFTITFKVETTSGISYTFGVDSNYKDSTGASAYDGITDYSGSGFMEDDITIEGTMDGYFSEDSTLIIYLLSQVSSDHLMTAYVRELTLEYDA